MAASVASIVALTAAMVRPLLFGGDGVTAATWHPASLPGEPPFLALAVTASLGSSSLSLLLCLFLTFSPAGWIRLLTCFVWLIKLVLPPCAFVLLGTCIWAVVDRVRAQKAKGPLPELQSDFIIYAASSILLLVAISVSLWWWWPKAFGGPPSHIVNAIAQSHRIIQQKRDNAKAVRKMLDVHREKRTDREQARDLDDDEISDDDEITPCLDHRPSDEEACLPPKGPIRLHSLPTTQHLPPSYHTREPSYPLPGRQSSLPPYGPPQPFGITPQPVVQMLPQLPEPSLSALPPPHRQSHLRRDSAQTRATPTEPRYEPELDLSDAPVSGPEEDFERRSLDDHARHRWSESASTCSSEPLRNESEMGLMGSFDPFEAVADAVGSSADQLRLIFCLIISIPLGAVFPRLPSSRSPGLLASSSAHLYSIGVAVWFLVFVLHLGGGCLQLFDMMLGTYLITLWGVHQQRTLAAKGRKPPFKWPWLVFFFAMGQLTVNHVYRYVYAVSLLTNEITGAMMVLVLKLVFFAWNAYDGQRPEAELDSAQMSQRFVEVPSLVSFLGYCTFFPSVNIGPAFTYNMYESFTSHTSFAASPRVGKGNRPAMPPGRRTAAAKRAAIGFFFLGLFATLAPSYGYERMLEDRFLSRSLLQRIAFLQIAGFFARTKYYAAWCIACVFICQARSFQRAENLTSEAGCIVAGLGYNASKGTWDATSNVRILGIELAQNWKTLLDNWNINTNHFLRECVYKRLARPGRKPGFKSTQMTFGTSAFWHGINPSYYLTFFTGGLLQALCRHIRSTIRPFFLPPAGRTSSPLKLLYDVLSIIALQTTLNYTVASFMLLEVRATLEAWRRLGYYGHWATFLPLLFFWSGGGKLVRRPAKQQIGGKREQEAYDAKLKRETAGSKGAGQLGHADVGYEELKKE